MYYFDLVIEVINNNGYFQGIMHCVKTQNNLYSYNMIAHSLEKDPYFRKQRKNN